MSLPACGKDFEQLFGEWMIAHTEWMIQMETKIDSIGEQVKRLVTTLDRFAPLLERYEQAGKANGFRAQRQALKGK